MVAGAIARRVDGCIYRGVFIRRFCFLLCDFGGSHWILMLFYLASGGVGASAARTRFGGARVLDADERCRLSCGIGADDGRF